MGRFALALLLCAAPVFALPQTGGMGTLSGVVLDAKGKPAADVSVFMQSASGDSPHATTTNAQGRFFFVELIHGYYDVRASTKGAVSQWKHNLEVRTGKQTNVTLRLVPRSSTRGNAR